MLSVETLEERSLPSASLFAASAHTLVSSAGWQPPPTEQVHVAGMSIGEVNSSISCRAASSQVAEAQFWGSIGEEIPTAQSHDSKVDRVELFARHIGEEIPQ
jgi:hypothetical protein